MSRNAVRIPRQHGFVEVVRPWRPESQFEPAPPFENGDDHEIVVPLPSAKALETARMIELARV